MNVGQRVPTPLQNRGERWEFTRCCLHDDPLLSRGTVSYELVQRVVERGALSVRSLRDGRNRPQREPEDREDCEGRSESGEHIVALGKRRACAAPAAQLCTG